VERRSKKLNEGRNEWPTRKQKKTERRETDLESKTNYVNNKRENEQRPLTTCLISLGLNETVDRLSVTCLDVSSIYKQ